MIDFANDAVFLALRAPKPDAANVDSALAALQRTLAAPVPATGSGGVRQVAGIDITDAGGHPLPYEFMAGKVRDALKPVVSPDPAILDLQAKALERCNADDDANSDAFSAKALSMIKD